jgi:chromate reductase
MHDVLAPVKLLGLPGSLRRASFSRATLVGLRDNLPEKVTIEICDPQLPLYNEDHDRWSNAPDQVPRFRDMIGTSDGIVIVTPEYNHGLPGVLKNALDWASRPFGKSALTNKPVLGISVSPAFTGGVRAHAQLNETLLAVPALVLGGPQVVIGNIGDKIKDGILDHQPSLDFALSALRRLITQCRLGSPRLIA